MTTAKKKATAKKTTAKAAATQAPADKATSETEPTNVVIQPAKPDTTEEVEVCVVTVKQDGFRRAGRAWTGTTVVEADELIDEQIRQLEDDPMFDVQFGVTGD